VFDDFLLEHHMPNLRRLKNEGYSGILESTDPAITPAAWTACITGCLPSTHGIAGFQQYNFKENRMEISSSGDCLVPNIWQELSNQGYKVASINVPWTYPCPEINGIMVAGYGCPGIEMDLTYPKDFKNRLLERVGDYEVRADWNWEKGDSLEKFDENVKRVERSFEQKYEAAKLVSEEINWDVMMVEFQDIDMMQHRIWSYLKADLRDRYVPQRDRLFKAFEKLDGIIGRLMDLAETEELITVVVSDHGFSDRVGDIEPNSLLYQWGYLRLYGRLRRKIAREIRSWKNKLNWRLFPSKRLPECFDTERLNVNIDYEHSKAVVMHTSISGYLYINVKGRQPSGFIEPGEEYRNVLEDLRRRFTQVVNPYTGRPLFARVATPEELYGVSGLDPERFGDLILVPSPGHNMSLRAHKRQYVKEARDGSSYHHPEGIFSISGANINPANDRLSGIVNIAPTVYAAVGAKIPAYMDGEVLIDVFSRQPELHYQQQQERIRIKSTKGQRLSRDEQAAIAEKLSQLGYLE